MSKIIEVSFTNNFAQQIKKKNQGRIKVLGAPGIFLNYRANYFYWIHSSCIVGPFFFIFSWQVLCTMQSLIRGQSRPIHVLRMYLIHFHIEKYTIKSLFKCLSPEWVGSWS